MTTTTTAAATKLKTSAMIASFADPGQRTTPAPFGHALVKAAQADDRIVGLTADLAKYTDMHIFAQAYPDRFYQLGMAEQLLLGFDPTAKHPSTAKEVDQFLRNDIRSTLLWKAALAMRTLDWTVPKIGLQIVKIFHWLQVQERRHRERTPSVNFEAGVEAFRKGVKALFEEKTPLQFTHESLLKHGFK